MTAPPAVVEIQGRTGNQLFCYAFGEGLRHRTGSEVAYRVGVHDAGHYSLPRLLAKPPRLATDAELRSLGIYSRSTVADKLRRRIQRVQWRGHGLTSSPPPAEEKNPFAFDEALLLRNGPRLYRGYFQNERYFDCVADKLVGNICLPDTSRSSADRTLPAPTVGVQFRRGDFVGLGWTLPLSYYERALRALHDHAEVGSILLFGDDPDFVRLATDYFAASYGTVIDAYRLSSDPFEHMSLLAACDHCVLSNSSFAWWSAWIGDHRRNNTDRVVIAPTRWHADGNPAPDRWLRLSHEECDGEIDSSAGHTRTGAGCRDA